MISRKHVNVGAGLCVLLAAIVPVMVGTSVVQAASGPSAVLQTLERQDAYVSQQEMQDGHARAGDVSRLEAAARSAVSKGVQEKFAIVHSYPSTYPNVEAAAHDLRRLLGLSGVLVLVAPSGLAVSSDKLSSSELSTIASRDGPLCLRGTFTDCAISAGNDAVSQIKSDQSSSSRGAAIFWVIVLIIIAGVILLLARSVLGRRRAVTSRLDDLRRAASNTLSQADDAVTQIESSPQGQSMPADVRAEYDRVLALRDQARTELDRAASPEMLIQANQDAAQAVLGLQGVMRRLGVQSPLANPLNTTPGHRCFYCGRDDRPPYTRETVSDGKGNSMEVEVCAVDAQRLAQGQRPQVATVSYNGSQVPWWAVPNNPYYYNYGGPTWQYWLPFIIGMDVGGWFGGGWGGGPGWGYGGDWDDGGWSGGDAGSDIAAQQQPSDTGGFDFGGWAGGDSSGGGWDSGGGGWDSGGGGGDSGGWDSGGSDSGGWS